MAILLEPELLVAIGLLVILVVGLVVFGLVRRSRRHTEQDRLKERFGPEYEGAVRSAGSRQAVQDLHERVADRESFTPQDPGEETRGELRRRMAELQFRFVDEPADVLLETQRVVLDGLRACGYPVAEDRERALKLLSVDHPEVTTSLRTLLDGAYGRDVGRMQALFVDTKRALREVVRVTYGPDDMQRAGARADRTDEAGRTEPGRQEDAAVDAGGRTPNT